jgi:acyl transferase domain-containing protein/acyl carrier protein
MSKPAPKPVAIIGVSARLPGADSLDAFWDVLRRDEDVIGEVSPERWDRSAFYDADQNAPGKTYSTKGGFLAGIDEFDAPFFGIEASDARKMDPQQRLALQEAWRTFEDAGYAPDRLRGRKVGVFVGARTGDYHDSILDRPEDLEPQALMGHDTSVLSARISYFLDLKGPNLTVNTACSSMGVALHLAMQSLRSGEVDLALVGGVHLMSTAQRHLMHSRSRLLSRVGQCRPFDAAADGFVLGEAVGFVLLKRRPDAVADRDWIYGNVLATGVNHSGFVEKGIAAPNPEAQAALIREVLGHAAVPAESIGYVEAHGTGTYKGDAIEANALREAYGTIGAGKRRRAKFAIGSVKANVGHSLTAAVLPGLLKILLSFRHRKLVRQLHFATANELLQIEDAPFRIQAETTDWPGTKAQPRRAALSAFSYSGTNFHMILEEEVRTATSSPSTKPCLITLSAKTRADLGAQVRQLETWLAAHRAEVGLPDVAHTLAVGRAHLACRAAFVANDVDDCGRQLRNWREDDFGPSAESGQGAESVQADAEVLLAKIGAKKGKVSRAMLQDLAALYRRGATLRWELLDHASARTVPLPGYAFAKHRYWLRDGHQAVGNEPAVTLFFCRRDDIYQSFVSARASRTVPDTGIIVLIKPGDGGFRRLGPRSYQIDPRNEADYRRVVESVGPLAGKHVQVVHLWNYECEALDYLYHGDIERCLHHVECSLDTGARSLSHLRRVLAQADGGASLAIVYLYYGLQPQSAMAAGWQEDEPTGGLTSFQAVRLPDRASPPADVAALLARETDRRASGIFSERAYDHPRSERPLPGAPANSALDRLRLDPGRTYLIDVGDEEQGVAFVEEWNRAGVGKRVVLAGPARASEVQARLGDSVIVLPAGLTGSAEIDRLRGDLARHGVSTIHGVVRFVGSSDRADFQRNVTATLLLDDFTQESPLDFFILSGVGDRRPTGAARFADAFVELRAAWVRGGQRRGATLFQTAAPESGAESGTAFRRLFELGAAASASIAAPVSDAPSASALELRFKRIVADVLKVAPGALDLSASLDRLKFDSMRVVDVSDRLQRTAGTELRPSVFYKHKTLRGVMDEWLKLAAPAAPAAAAPAVPAPTASRPQSGTGAKQGDGMPEPIAIVGMSGRFPMARNLGEFWENLCAGRNCIREIPRERWDWRQGAADSGGEANGQPQWGGFIDDIDKFDPQFFGISTREAELMDPQQRLFLQCAWHAIEDAGYDPTGLAGSATGVFVGVATCDYASLLEATGQQRQAHSPIGCFHSILANRLSYLLDLRGPSQPIDTACSSSLVAVHRAIQSIRSGQCTQAIVGGVNALLTSPLFAAFQQAGMLSPDGRCKTFDAAANGYVRGEGAGVLFLKPLRQALADGDAIHAVIRGSAEGHGGRASSLTAPSSQAQADVLAQAYREAGIDPQTIGYIEAHGTGTALGDPIEVDGLKQAFAAVASGGSGPGAAACGLGSVKTNIGHLEAAAGIAGLIKVVLAMKHRALPGNLHFAQRNPLVALDGSPFFVVERTQSWPARVDERGTALPRRAGVSSFGFGGVNAHVVVEEYVAAAQSPAPAATPSGREHLIVLSAKTDDRLREAAVQLLGFVQSARAGASEATLAEIAYTLQVGRTAMDERLAVQVESLAALETVLTDFLGGREVAGLCRGRAGRDDETLALFADDEAGREAVGKWLQQGKWDRLLGLWAKGLRIDWGVLYGNDRPARIHLPTYPFALERYWVEAAAPQRDHSPARVDAPARREVAPRRAGLLKKQWEPCALGAHAPAPGNVLILASEATLGLATRLQHHFAESEIIAIDAREQAPRNPSTPFAGWIDLSGCAAQRGDDLGWLTWVQRLVEQAAEKRAFALGVTRGLEAFQAAPVNVAAARPAALYRMLSSEYAAVRSRHLDLDPRADDDTAAAQIAAEFSADGDDVEVCYRGGGRYRAGLREVPWAESERAVTFPSDQVLWITGGTRGLGALCAAHFVRRAGVKKLVLTGRETLPAREEWAAWERKTGPMAEKIRTVRALEAQGADVRVFSLDLTDASAVRRCCDAVKQELGPIGGLLHAAGAVDEENPAFIRKSPTGIAGILAPKIAGTDCLLDVFQDEPLAFVVLFSSVSAIVPALAAGLSDYAMANAYLDYAAEARSRALPIVSVRWPSWSETGMGEVKSGAYAQSGFLSLTDAEGLRFLDRILAERPAAVVTPVIYDPAHWTPDALLRHRPRTPSAAVAAAGNKIEASPSIAEAARVWLTGLFAQELKMGADKLNADTPFQDYGMDSILLAQAWKQINGKLGTRLDPSAVFEHPTLRALSSWLARTQTALLTPLLSGQAAATTPTPADDGVSAPVALARTSAVANARGPADIAVIGMSCRFPGAADLAGYWKLLVEGRTAIARVPAARWNNPEGFVAGLLENITDFDPDYFLLSPEDAAAMDPQALLVLEESLHLIHHAGYTPAEVKGAAIGVYLGARAQPAPDSARLEETRNPILAVGQNYLAANVSRCFDLRGPSLVVDTACSSALVGMNLAIQALRSGDIDSAVVGGVSLLASDAAHRLFRQRNLLSRDGSFHLFDGRASGVVLGEGVGLVMLKRLDQAEADGDRIYAVVKGLAVNNDGRTAGPATPNLQAQKAVMQAALERSGVRTGDVDFLEANGTGSEVTDLLELKAVEAVYGGSRTTRCSLGSIKPNIGHPLCAEGIASFIKLVLMLEHRQQPPFLSGERPMAHYDLVASPFAFRREAGAWAGRPCRAALNCFADGGTNVHAILESWEAKESRPPRRAPIAPPILRRRNVRQPVRNPWTAGIAAAHPFVGNHQAYGQALLPGLAYIDILYQHLRDKHAAGEGLELANVSIHRPLAVRPGHTISLEVVTEEMSGGWRMRIEGTDVASDGAAGTKTCFVTAEMRQVTPAAFTETLDLAAIRATAKTTPLASAYAHFQAKGLVHSGPMKAEGTLYATDDALIVELALPADARAEAAAHLFHPTLIDGAAVGAGPMFAELVAGEDRLFLPLFYGRFRASALLRERCFARVRKATLRRKNELLYSDMEFFNAAGVKVAELTDFAYKLVRDAGLIQASPGSDRTFPSTEQSTIVTVLDGATAQAPERTPGVAAHLLRLVIGAKVKRPAGDVDLRRGYYELGLDSSMLLEVVAALSKKLAVSLSPTLLFERETPAELAAHLEQTYPAELAQLPNVTEPDRVQRPELVVRAFRLDGPAASRLGADRVAAEALVADLLADRLALWVEGGELKVRAEAGRLTPPLGERIAQNAGAIAAVVGDRKLLPLTRSQKRYWVLSALQPEKSAYNNPIGMRLRGAVDIERLREAFLVLMNAHHVLRSTCPRLAKVPVLEIAPPLAEAPVHVTRLLEPTAEGRERALSELAGRESQTPIHPATGPNVRIQIVDVAAGDVAILLTAHHTVFDGYSYLPVMSELMRIYRALEKRTIPATAGLTQYENYSLREQPEGNPRSRAYWQEHLRGAPAAVALPLDQERAMINAGHGDTRSVWLEADAYRRINAAIQQERVTLFAFMLSILKTAIAGWSGQTDLVFGTTVQCRDDEADKAVIGDFTNFMPIRTRADEADTFSALLQKVYRTSLLCLEHKHFPFDEIVALAAPAPRNINPVYNILVNQLPSISEMEERLSDGKLRVGVSNNRLLNKSAMLDLRFEWYEENGGLRLICEYNTELFRDETIERFLRAIDGCLGGEAYAGASLATLMARFPRNDAKGPVAPARSLPASVSAPAAAADLEAFLIEKIRGVKDVPGLEARRDAPFFELGLGSFDVANLSAELEAHYPAFVVGDLFKHPTIRALAGYLAELGGRDAGETADGSGAAGGLIDFELFRT